MPSYRDLMPSLGPLQRVIERMTDFSLPSSDLREMRTRAQQGAATAVRPQQQSLRNVRSSLDQQRTAALNALQRQRNLLPQLFQRNLRDTAQQAHLQEMQRGAFDSGLRLQNILQAGVAPLQQQAQALQQIGGQHAQTETDYLGQLMSQVFQPQRELAAAQGEEASKRYQAYVQEAQNALFEGNVRKAESLLNEAQLEYNALIAAQENRMLRQQARYQRQLNAHQAGLGGGGGAASGAYSGIVNKYAQQYGVNPGLISRVIQAESSGNPRARSHAGAQGLMQLMPATARSLGVRNAYDPDQNIRGGTKYLSQQLKRWGGNEALALASYNAGPGRVQQAVRRAGSRNWSAVSRYLPRETQNYVAKILGR